MKFEFPAIQRHRPSQRGHGRAVRQRREGDHREDGDHRQEAELLHRGESPELRRYFPEPSLVEIVTD